MVRYKLFTDFKNIIFLMLTVRENYVLVSNLLSMIYRYVIQIGIKISKFILCESKRNMRLVECEHAKPGFLLSAKTD